MLDEISLDNLCSTLGLPGIAKPFIQNIRTSEPSRSVQGRKSNVIARYPSKKTGKTIQAESHKVELAAIYEMEYDDDVLEYYDQPPPIPLNCADAKGRNRGFMHTPDFFAIKKEACGYYELKPEQELERLHQKNPNRYTKDEGGNWICPPGIEFAKKYGLFYEVWSDKEFNWAYQQNIIFLEDYLRREFVVAEDAKARILGFFSDKAYYTFKELLDAHRENTADDILAMIVAGDLFVDLHNSHLADQEKTLIFKNKNIYSFHIAATKEIEQGSIHPTNQAIKLIPGHKLLWDGSPFAIINAGQNAITLEGENGLHINLPWNKFHEYAKAGLIIGVQNPSEMPPKCAAEDITMGSDEEGLEIALIRYELLDSFNNGASVEALGVSRRTLFYWKSKYKESEMKTGFGLPGLIPLIKNRGNYTPKISKATIDIINDAIRTHYATPTNKTLSTVHREIQRLCQESGTSAPCFKSFSKHLKSLPQYDLAFKREGKRAAYEHKDLFYELDNPNHRHGSRPFEICHIDHTELDIELLSSDNIPLGRPWLSIMIDAYSRRILAFLLTFDPPSYRTCMQLIRKVVLKHARIPQILVVDNGPEFRSAYFDFLLAKYECTKKLRPAGEARFGSIIERMFRTTDDLFIHNLAGNTQVTKNVRQVTKSVNPKGQAIWSLPQLQIYLDKFFNEIYANNIHPSLGKSPVDAFVFGIERFGARPNMIIPYTQDFIISTLPSTPKGTAQVSSGRGVKINYIYYWCEKFRNPELHSKQLPVRFDPFNCGIAYVLIEGVWTLCRSEHYPAFANRSLKEIELASKAIIKSRQNSNEKAGSINAARLARFLIEDVSKNEEVLRQHIKDMESSIANADIQVCDLDIRTADTTKGPEGNLPHCDQPEAPPLTKYEEM